MSSHQSSTSTTYISSSSTSDGQTQSYTASQTSSTDHSGTTIHRFAQRHGEPVVQETTRLGPDGRTIGSSDGHHQHHKIEDVTDQEQSVADQKYEERIEDEYAKREGGA
jgi:hypothetical protein